MNGNLHLTTEQIRRYHNRALDPAELLVADDHLAACESCRLRAADRDDMVAAYSFFVDPDQDVVPFGEAPLQLVGSESRVRPHLSFERLAAYVDGTLDEAGMEGVRAHLDTCRQCAAEAQDLADFRTLLQSTATGEG